MSDTDTTTAQPEKKRLTKQEMEAFRKVHFEKRRELYTYVAGVKEVSFFPSKDENDIETFWLLRFHLARFDGINLAEKLAAAYNVPKEVAQPFLEAVRFDSYEPTDVPF